MEEKNEVFPILDLSKFVASILIVFLHSHALSCFDDTFAWYFTEILTRLAVPFFS